MSSVGDVVIPGDVISSHLVEPFNCKVVIGPGLQKNEDKVIAITSGVLKRKESAKKGPIVVWIDTHQKRYVPRLADPVVGVITSKVGDIYRVDIGSAHQANLSYLAFEGATKRNRPNVQVGDLVYARILVANRDMEPEIVCIDSYGRKKDMGVLEGGGFMVTTSLHVARKLISRDCNFMAELGRRFKFEAAIGMNGRIWARSNSITQTISICNAFRLSEHMTEEEFKVLCDKMAEVLNWEQYWT